MEPIKQSIAKYGVEIKPDSERRTRNVRGNVHVECLDVSHVLTVLDAYDGDVRVFDREKRDLVFEGRVADLRELLWSGDPGQGEGIQEFMACRPLVVF